MDKNVFTLSANIENGITENSKYIVTLNVEKVLQEIVNAYQTGIHSFTIIGTYGTGKSSFILNLEHDLDKKAKTRTILKDPKLLTTKKVEILNILGDVKPLSEILKEKLAEKGCKGQDTLSMLRDFYSTLKKEGKFLFIAIDEFGKVLEYAAKYNPESELYFFQKLTEFVNVPTREILLLTTLHQNFSAYAKKLSQAQKNEWTKVKGRFQEVVFAEPVEQLLCLAAEHINDSRKMKIVDMNFCKLHDLAVSCKYVSSSFTMDIASKLYPLDSFAAYAITKAIQRYGQNERSLFNFLNLKGAYSILDFKYKEHLTYNLAEVYNYIKNTFHSYLNDAHADAMGWSSIQLSIERVEGYDWKDSKSLLDAIKIVKAIGLLNLFGKGGFSMTALDLGKYASLAMDVEFPSSIIKELERLKIIRYAEYKKRYILFEGTDINIEEEVEKAGMVVPRPANYIDDLRVYFNKRVMSVRASYFHRGTPRYFEYQVVSEATDILPTGDVDGFVQMVFSTKEDFLEKLAEFSRNCQHAIIFAYFNETDDLVDSIHKIKKYSYILEKVLLDKSDRVAIKEVTQLMQYEQTLLNKRLNDSLFSYSNDVTWIYKGETIEIASQRAFNQLLSHVCDDIYSLTPIINNELFNRHKLSSSISAAKAKYLQALLNNGNKEDLGFEETRFPPEKTIYYTLLKNTGLHVNGEFADEPSNPNIKTLWEACEDFLRSSMEKPIKVSELIKILSSQPYKLKDGVLDFWIPTYLFIKRDDYTLYGSNNQYIPNINNEFFDLLKKHPGEFKVKAYSVDGVRLRFFNQYRKVIGQNADSTIIKGDSFVETIKPFFFFYSKQLNDYAKHTKKIDHRETLRFRDVLAKAKDPEKTFFEDLPEALGYDKENGEHFIDDYCYVIQRAIRELRKCYSQLIDRIEAHIVESLGLSSYEYPAYVQEMQTRLSKVKMHLLTSRQKEFYQHFMAQFDKREEWFQSTCYAILEHPLDKLRDEEEPKLLDDFVYLFRECELQAVASESLNYKIDDNEQERSKQLESKIDRILTGNTNLDVYTLMRLLQKRINKT